MSVSDSGALARDVKAMGLVGLAHGCSHYYQLVLPALFPFLIDDLGTSLPELGAVMTVFFIASGLGQPVAGFVVDRIGARNILFAGLATYSAGLLLASMAPSVWWLMPAMALAALGNCVFHPADFAIMNASISRERLGRAFSVHTLGGNLGWAAAPISMIALGGAFGWRWALVAAAGVGIVILVLLALSRDDLKEAAAAGGPGEAPRMGLRPLLTPPVLLCFGYFLLLAAALIAVQNFLPIILDQVHGTPVAVAGMALTGFLLGASAGVVVGGFIADATPRHGGVVAGGLFGAAAVFLAVAEIDFPNAGLVAAISAAGFLQGVTTPSRDLLVRSATPPGASGRVFGFVYSGLDVGSAVAPLTTALILAHGDPKWSFWFVALMLLGAVFTAVSIGGAQRTAQPQPAE
jgi:MFS family permease